MEPVTGLRLLLDTHALLWWVANDASLSATADRVLQMAVSARFDPGLPMGSRTAPSRSRG